MIARWFTRRFVAYSSLLMLLGLGALPAAAQTGGGGLRYDPGASPAQDMIKQTGLEQKLDSQVPVDALQFREETGNVTPLSAYFGKKPVLLMMPFYQCTGICTTELNGLVKALQKIRYKPGSEFNVVIVSINPKEGPLLAKGKKEDYLQLYGHPETADGWHFLTGDEANIRRLADAVGYHYVYDARTDRYSHPAGLMVLTPQGKVSRYFYGAEYNPRDLRFALMDASENKIGSLVEEIQLFCFHYDPATGKYGLVIMRVLQLAGALTVLCLGGFLTLMFRYERRRGQLLPPEAPEQMRADLK
ncbi:MAG TPA: SCO family protein [Chthonomonadaceae bacterium]|nr:SCO family protein [Chthonomonadaceae bacterium]